MLDEHGRRHSVVGVDDGHNVEADQFGEGAEQVLASVFVVEIGFGDEDLDRET